VHGVGTGFAPKQGMALRAGGAIGSIDLLLNQSLTGVKAKNSGGGTPHSD